MWCRMVWGLCLGPPGSSTRRRRESRLGYPVGLSFKVSGWRRCRHHCSRHRLHRRLPSSSPTGVVDCLCLQACHCLSSTQSCCLVLQTGEAQWSAQGGSEPAGEPPCGDGGRARATWGTDLRSPRSTLRGALCSRQRAQHHQPCKRLEQAAGWRGATAGGQPMARLSFL